MSELSNYDIARLEEVGGMLALLSPYSPEEAVEIVKAIATCRPLSEIAVLIKLSPNDLDGLRDAGIAGAKAGTHYRNTLT